MTIGKILLAAISVFLILFALTFCKGTWDELKRP